MPPLKVYFDMLKELVLVALLVNDNFCYLSSGQSGASAVTLKWNNCGEETSPLQMKTITVSPEPVSLPGVFQFSLEFSIRSHLHSPIQLTGVMEKQIAIWVPVPCFGNYSGICNLPDLCPVLPFICPDVFRHHGFPCQCPIPKGDYKVSNTTISMSPRDLPIWFTEAPYRMTFNLTSGSQQIGCIHLQFSTSDPK